MTYSKFFVLLTSVLVSSCVVGFYASGWTEPTQPFPGGNIALPLNVSSTGQTKAGGLILNTGGAVYGLIVDKGNVGIGTTSPKTLLQVGQDSQTVVSNGQITIAKSSGAGGARKFKIGLDNNYHLSIGDFGYWADDTYKPYMTIKWDNGNVGIGTTAPSQKLDVAGYVKGQTGLCIGNDCRTSWPGGGTVGTMGSPAYDSGWITATTSATITHNLGTEWLFVYVVHNINGHVTQPIGASNFQALDSNQINITIGTGLTRTLRVLIWRLP